MSYGNNYIRITNKNKIIIVENMPNIKIKDNKVCIFNIYTILPIMIKLGGCHFMICPIILMMVQGKIFNCFKLIVTNIFLTFLYMWPANFGPQTSARKIRLANFGPQNSARKFRFLKKMGRKFRPANFGPQVSGGPFIYLISFIYCWWSTVSYRS